MLTVKKLIEKLQEIDNKFSEVYILKPTSDDFHIEIKDVKKVNNKVLILS